jgi:hypothetical protein
MMRPRTLCRVALGLSLLFVFLQYRILVLHYNNETSNAKPNSDTSGTSRDSICSKIPSGSTAASIWKSHKPQIFEALKHPRDVNGLHHNWTKQLLELLTPTILQKSLKSQPHHALFRPLATKLLQRIRHPESSPPLKILVFGGSIVEGSGCERSPTPGGKLNFESLQECAWPYRLQFFLNRLFGSKGNNLLVQIHNLAVGGTHSEAAIPVLEYWLSPVFAPDGPDIVVNAYSANDNLPPAFHATKNTTIDIFHWVRVYQRNRQFVQAAAKSSSCRTGTPLILYVNDYVGNQQESIWGEGQVDEVVQGIADYDASVAYVSAAHMVQQWVFADTLEHFFSGIWTDRKGRPTVNVHFGMAGHVTTLLAIAYGLLQLVLDFCDFDISCHHQSPVDVHVHVEQQQVGPPEQAVQIDLPTKEWVKAYQPPIIIPNMTQRSWKMVSTRAKHISSSQFKSKSESKSNDCPSSKGNTSPCVFAFLAAPLGTHQQQDRLADFLGNYTLHNKNNGWRAQSNLRQGGFQNKLGLVAMHANANMALGFQHISQPVRVMTVHYIKSYGDMWKNSRVRFLMEIFYKQQKIHQESFELEGVHDQNVSISYFHRLVLGREAPVGSSIRFQMELVGGQTFKINALMCCSR